MTIAEQGVERLSVTTSLRSEIDVRSEREGGIVEAMVPVGLIDQTEVPVDERHVTELVESMTEKELLGIDNGQLTPILLAPVIGKEKLSIIDGFHRSAATERRGSMVVYATVMPPMTEEDVMDLRILTATSHKNVSFARMYKWVSESWSKTSWAAKGITDAQAFNLASNKKMNGRYLGLTAEETADIREWAQDKCVRWGTVPTSIQKVMNTAQIADPDLMNQARTRSSGHELKFITPDHLSTIAKAFPRRYGEQRVIADMATSKNLSINDVKVVLEVLKGITTVDQLRSAIDVIDWSEIFTKKPTQKATESTRTTTPEVKPSSVVYTPNSINRKLLIAELNIGRLSLENSVLRGDFAAGPLHESREPLFTINIGGSAELKELLEPVSGANESDAIADRLDTVSPKLIEIFIRNGLSDAQAAHAVRSIGQRLGRDIEEGILKHATLNKQTTIDSLIRSAINEEISAARKPVLSPLYTDEEKRPEFKLNTGLRVAPEVQATARTTMALVGLMGANVHGVSQILSLDRLRAGQMIETVHGRLVSAERGMTIN